MSSDADVAMRIAMLSERVADHDVVLGQLSARILEIDESIGPAVAFAASAEVRARDAERRLAIGEGTLAGLALRCEELERRLELIANASGHRG